MSVMCKQIITLFQSADFQDSLCELSYGLAIAVIGIFFTLFTVFHSFLETKKNDLKAINQKIRQGDDSPMTLAEQSFCNDYIKQRKTMNQFFFWTLCVAAVILIYAAVLSLVGNKNIFSVVLLVIFDIIGGGWLIFVLIEYFRIYIKKVHKGNVFDFLCSTN